MKPKLHEAVNRILIEAMPFVSNDLVFALATNFLLSGKADHHKLFDNASSFQRYVIEPDRSVYWLLHLVAMRQNIPDSRSLNYAFALWINKIRKHTRHEKQLSSTPLTK